MLSVIMPVYNEGNNVTSTIEENIFVLNEAGIEYEILIIDDGSLDSTVSQVKALKEKYHRISFYQHPKNMGFGAAIKTGISHSRGNLITFSPADNSLELGVLKDFFREIDSGADVVVGCRREREGYTLLMRFNSRIYNLLLRYFSGLRLKDFNWIHLYKKEIFRYIDLTYEGAFMTAEVLIKAHRLGLDIKEVNTKMRRRIYGKASVTRFKIISKVILNFIDFFIWNRIKEKFDVWRWHVK